MADDEPSNLEFTVAEAVALRQFKIGIAAVLASKPNDGLAQRAQYFEALTEISEFLHLIGLKWERSQINLLAEMLQDLDLGTVHPVLKPSRTANRPPSSTQDLRGRAFAALAVAALVAGGYKRQLAAQYLARKYPELDRFSGNEGVKLSKALLNWERQHRAGDVLNSEAFRLFAQKLPGIVDGIKAAPAERRLKGSETVAGGLVQLALALCN
ncbi:MAG TPA: hypothetical protein VIL09_17650 [Microvirga sp.]|jgi:hypothetical protein